MMERLGGRIGALRELSDSLGLSDLVVGRDELKKTQVYYRNQSKPGCVGLADETVELVISGCDDASLLRFIARLEDTLYDSCVSIKNVVPLWGGGVVITILPRAGTLVTDKLDNMSDVEKVEAESLAVPATASFPKRFEFLRRTKPSRRLHITLKETRQELVPVLA